MNQTDHNATSGKKERPAELTSAAIILGIVLSVVMGAANVYLGLKAGMTVSASIPAAVVAMGVLRAMGRKSILESNLVQTAASAGESLAAGIIFTMPALILAGIWTDFDFWTTSLIALGGGLLGVLMMIPMRQVFVVDNTELKYPEGIACAEVLRAGAGGDDDQAEQEGGTGIGLVILGTLTGAIVKFAISFMGLMKGTVQAATVAGSRVFYFGCDASPALLSVGYIVGFAIALQIFLGGAIGWIIAIPLLGTEGIEVSDPLSMAESLWAKNVRYMGVGAMLVGGLASIWRVRNGLIAAVRQVTGMFSDAAPESEAERNIGTGSILALSLLCVCLIAALYFSLLKSPGLTILTTIAMVIMSFFFAAVASYIVGLVGNSNSPVSGMTITAVLGTGALIYLFGFQGEVAMIATLGVAGVVCCVACTSGDVCNDLKTGHLVGASPRHQQIMQVIGVFTAAFVMAPVMTVLHEGSIKAGTGGIGGAELRAPQAGLFASLAQGFFGDTELPHTAVAIGIAIGVALLIGDFFLARSNSSFRLYVMPVAVGIYLPLSLSVPILLGGILNWVVQRAVPGKAEKAIKRGVLICSGVIAGESLVGVLIGALNYKDISIEPMVESALKGSIIAVVVMVGIMAMILVASTKKE